MSTATRKNAPHPPLPQQRQEMPGETGKMLPPPDHGEESYKGSGRLAGRVAVSISGDIKDEGHCRLLVDRAMEKFGRFDILVNNAAHQRSISDIEDITVEELDITFRTNIYSMFFLCKFAIPHMKAGASVINTSSINAKNPTPHLLTYAATKGAIANFTAGLAALLAEKGIRVNAIAPGPIWTPLIPSTMPKEVVRISARTRRSVDQANRRNWPRHMSCSLPKNRAI